jgi:hypothetical protein
VTDSDAELNVSREAPIPDPAARSRNLTIWGIGASALYILTMLGWSISEQRELWAMDPNEFGDLLAGVFSPLAFLWLVLGFLQQGQELRASVRALELQGEELRNSVEQQRELVAVTREELEFQNERLRSEDEERDRASQPILEVSPTGSAGSDQPRMRSYSFRVINYGKAAADLRVTLEDGRMLLRRAVLDIGDHGQFKMDMPLEGESRQRLSLAYVDLRGLPRVKHFILRKDGQALAIAPE